MKLMQYTLAPLAAALWAGSAAAQVKEPPRAEKLDVQIRYRIRADRDERIRQFLALEKFLAGVGFDDARKNDPDRELDIFDPNAERFTGTISSKNVLHLLDDPHILNILFAPAGYTYPDSPENPVPIRVMIRDGLLPAEQQRLHGQAVAQLDRLGFREALGYDTRRYTQIKGTIPYKNLPKLMKDLRDEPSGWFFPDTPPDRLPRPLADRSPVRWVEVMPPAPQPPPFAPPTMTPAQARMTPGMRAVVADPAKKETPVRVVVLFASSIEGASEELRARLAGEYGPNVLRKADGSVVKGPDGQPALTLGATLEGVLGNLASIRFDRPADVERFAADPSIINIHLPRPATETITALADGTKPVAASDLLKSSGVTALQGLGYTGKGVKVLLVASDFSGADKLIGNGLPKNTHVLDLTTELNPDIRPLPVDPNRAGNGTAAARALALAAPSADLFLVRVDPSAMYQLATILRGARGGLIYSEALRSRLGELTRQTTELTRRKEAAINEYRQAFEDLSDDVPARNRRARAKAALDAVNAEQAEFVKRIDRMNNFRKEVVALLADARVVVNTLEWESGHPLDAVSLMSQALESLAVPQLAIVRKRAGDPASAPRPHLVWVQAASQSGPAVWGGAFHDANRNATMEFAAPGQPLPPGSWTPEMNFLGFQAPNGQMLTDLPAGAKLRFTMQWREPIDPNLPTGERPIYPVVLRVFHQLDPNGEKRPSDEMAEVARSVGGPYPIRLTQTDVIYEQILDFTVPAVGRYALVVATGYRPEPILPALAREAEINPRLVLETRSGKPADGRAVFRSYFNPAVGVGIPGDSLGVVTIGSGTPGELIGGGTGLTLRGKPNFFGPHSLDIIAGLRGTGIATAYVGGIAADLVQAGAAGPDPFVTSGFQQGKPAVAPEGWLRYLKPAAEAGK